MGYLATEIIVLLAGAAVIGLIIGWALFGLGKNKAATTTVAVRDEKTDNELKSERDSRKKAEVRILELEARETNFGERLQERDTKIAELMHQLDEQARFRVQSAAQVEERDHKIAALEKTLAERTAELAAQANAVAPVALAVPESTPGADPALLAEKDEEIARLTEEAQRLSEEVAALTTGLENLKASDVQHAARVAQLERENAELRATLVTTADATPTTREEKDQIIARLNEEVTGLRAAYEAAEQALEEQDAAIDKLTRDLLTAQKKLHAQPEPAPAKAGPTRGGAAAKGSAPSPSAAPPVAPVAAPPLPGPLEAAESTVAVSLDALVAQIDASPAPKSATPPPIPPPLPPAPVAKAPAQPAPVEASESTVAISLDALVAQIDSGPAKAAPPPLPPAAPAAKPAPAVDVNESTVAISLDALVAQIDSGPAKASPPPVVHAPVAPAAPSVPPAPSGKAGFDLSEATVALSLDALVAQIDSGPAKAPAPTPAPPVVQPKAPQAPQAPEPNESTVAISLDALVAQIEAGGPKAPPPPPAPAPPAAVEANESTVAISLADLVAAVDSEPEVTPLELDAPPAPAGAFDDLQRIRGIGSNTAKRLNSAGIRTWRQMAALSERDLSQVADLLKISLDKIKREQWVEQARALTGA